jgi:hypothetical protein
VLRRYASSPPIDHAVWVPAFAGTTVQFEIALAAMFTVSASKAVL